MRVSGRRTSRSNRSRNRICRLGCEPLEARRLLATVTSLADDMMGGTLREALATGDPTIDFAVSGTITLTSGALTVDHSVDINAVGEMIIIDGADMSRVFTVDDGMMTNSFVAIRNLTVTGGFVVGSGGGISNAEDLTLDNVSITDSMSIGSMGITARGGGVFSSGPLTVVDSTISGNTADFGSAASDAYGGGIASVGDGVSLTISTSAITGNTAVGGSGGGIFKGRGELTVTSSTVTGNFAGIDSMLHGSFQRTGDAGGGIAAVGDYPAGYSTSLTIDIDDTNIYGNTVRNDIVVAGATATPSGGGLYVRGDGTVTITDSDISNNSAEGIISLPDDPQFTEFGPDPRLLPQGGGLKFQGMSNVPNAILRAVIDPTTISANFSGGSGGGGFIADDGDDSVILELDEVTVSGNTAVETGGGLYIAGGPLPYASPSLSAFNPTITGRSGVAVNPAATGCVIDNYSLANGPELTHPRPGLADEVANPNPRQDCDGTLSNRYFVESLTFPTPAVAIDSAIFRIAMKPVSLASNDAINLFSSTWPTTTRDVYNIETLVDGGTWEPAQFPNGVTIDIPISPPVLEDVAANQRLDIYVQDDTVIDYTQLFLQTSTSLLMRSSTVSDNAAENGGGIWVKDAPVALTNSTISTNAAGQDGGGIYSYQSGSATTTLDFVTVANNSALNNPKATGNGGGGIWHEAGGFVLDNSIVADNSAEMGAGDISDRTDAIVGSYSLIGDPNGHSITPTNGNIVNVASPQVGLLDNYGGPTMTHLPLSTSSALGAANPAATLANDQRGRGRPGPDGNRDMGAVERDGVVTGLGDFNIDGLWNLLDIDALTNAIAAGSMNLGFDMNGDGVIDGLDLTEGTVGWLAVGGARNPTLTGGNPFLPGDANLDGVVDISDFNLWNSNKFTVVADWSKGDFNADGNVDISDFNIWNSRKFQTSIIDIYADNFSGAPMTPLNGTSPDIRPGSETWTATSAWQADGTLLAISVQPSAYLLSTPENALSLPTRTRTPMFRPNQFNSIVAADADHDFDSSMSQEEQDPLNDWENILDELAILRLRS